MSEFRIEDITGIHTLAIHFQSTIQTGTNILSIYLFIGAVLYIANIILKVCSEFNNSQTHVLIQ